MSDPKTQAELDGEAADALYTTLKVEADEVARKYVLARVPANLQELVTAKVDADYPEPTPAAPAEPTPA